MHHFANVSLFRPTPEPDRSGLSRIGWKRGAPALAVVLIAGIAFRVWIYRSRIGVPDSDEAIVGLMARHILHGHFTTFFFGQSYGGSQEALLAAPGFALFGSGWLPLRMVGIVLSAVAALIIWRVGRRTIGEPAAAVAGCLFWIWPPFTLDKLTHQYGFYATGVVYAALLVLLALRVVERPDWLRVGAFGLVLGIGFWQSSQIVPLALPVIAWTLWKQPQALRRIWIGVPLALVGALPWIVWNIRHDWGSFDFMAGETPDYWHRLRLFFSPVIPMALGIRVPFRQIPLGSPQVADLAYAILVALFIAGAARARHRNASVLYLIVAIFPFIYATNPKTSFSLTPTYAVILTPVLVLLIAQLATTYARALAIGALACAMTALLIHKMNHYDPWSQSQETPPRDLRPLIATLDELGLDRVYASYWLAYVLSFDTRERIIGAQNQFRGIDMVNGQAIPIRDPIPRYPPYQEMVRTARHGFVFFREGIESVKIIPELERHGYKRREAGPFVIYAPA